MDEKEVKHKIYKLWRSGKKDLNKVLKETMHLVKKGEAHIKEASDKTEKNLEIMVLSLQREKLYHELGKSLAKLSKSKWAKSKKIERLLVKNRDIGYKIKRLKQKQSLLQSNYPPKRQ